MRQRVMFGLWFRIVFYENVDRTDGCKRQSTHFLGNRIHLYVRVQYIHVILHYEGVVDSRTTKEGLTIDMYFVDPV